MIRLVTTKYLRGLAVDRDRLLTALAPVEEARDRAAEWEAAV